MMAPTLMLWRLFPAQAESSNVTDFFGQISGLVGLTCIAGIIWIALTAFVLQRAAERRRRAAQGLAPLPSLYASLWQTVRGQRAADRSVAARLEPSPLPRPATPAPDLALLTGDLPAAPLPRAWAESAPEPDAPPAAPAEFLPGSPLEGAAAPSGDAPTGPADAIELLRVWRDLSTGELIMEVDGRRFRSVDELRSADLERRFIGAVRDLSALARPSLGPVAAPPADQPAAPRAGSSLRQIGRVALGQAPVEPPAAGPRSIADQIEDLLQERLASLPAFRGRVIHVRPSAQGGVQIVVDDRQYEGVGEVDDPGVRALLEEVVREWEGTQ